MSIDARMLFKIPIALFGINFSCVFTPVKANKTKNHQ